MSSPFACPSVHLPAFSLREFNNHKGNVVSGSSPPGEAGLLLENRVQDRFSIGGGILADNFLETVFAKHLVRDPDDNT